MKITTELIYAGFNMCDKPDLSEALQHRESAKDAACHVRRVWAMQEPHVGFLSY